MKPSFKPSVGRGETPFDEAETRLRFIDPFFEALGWDIRNPNDVRVESTLDFYLKNVSTTMRGGSFHHFAQFVEQLPIRTIDLTNPDDKAMHD